MLNSQVGNTVDCTILKVGGELTIENAEELKALLVRLSEGTDSLSLDFSEIGTVHVAGLQILCSAHKSWSRAGKHIIYAPGTLDALTRAAKEAGYARTGGCMPLSQGLCLFTGGPHE